MKKSIASLAILALFKLSCSTGHWYVNANYQGIGSGTKAKPFTSISDALNVAKQGDTIFMVLRALTFQIRALYYMN